MSDIQVLVSDRSNREALASLIEQEHTVDRSTTVGDADLYVVDGRSLPEYREALRRQQRAVEPVFCPVVLVRRESTRIDLPAPDETADERLLIDEVVTAPVEPPVLFRRLSNLLQRRERDEDSRQAERRQRRLMQMLPVGVVEATNEAGGTYEFVNRTFVEMVDAESKAALRSKPVVDLYANPERRAHFMERLGRGESLDNEEVQIETLDGDRFWASLTVHPFEEEGEQRQLAAVIDISERREYREQLEETNDRMETVNRIVRHDIMNRLNVIEMTADLLERRADESLEPHVERIVRSNKRAIEHLEQMRNVVESTLDGPSEPEPVSLRDHLVPEVDEARDAFPEAEIEVTGDVSGVTVLAGELLHSVFRNLIRNAIKHNDSERPTVRLSVERSEETVRVRVADDGPGIPAALQESLFEKEHKGPESQGTGIGLYLVDTLVRQFGGEVRVADNDPTGTVFTVCLDRPS